MARVRLGGCAAVLRAPPARRRHDQVEPAEDHRRGDRLAVPEPAQARAEDLSRREPEKEETGNVSAAEPTWFRGFNVSCGGCHIRPEHAVARRGGAAGDKDAPAQVARQYLLGT